MTRQFSHIFNLLIKAKFKRRMKQEQGSTCMCVSCSANELQINSTNTALEPPLYFWIYSKAILFLPAYLELPTIHRSLILQMTPPTHAPQLHIPSPTVLLLPPKPYPSLGPSSYPRTPVQPRASQSCGSNPFHLQFSHVTLLPQCPITICLFPQPGTSSAIYTNMTVLMHCCYVTSWLLWQISMSLSTGSLLPNINIDVVSDSCNHRELFTEQKSVLE